MGGKYITLLRLAKSFGYMNRKNQRFTLSYNLKIK